jgi:basic amino acid/polyamine antiporter, APA family
MAVALRQPVHADRLRVDSVEYRRILVPLTPESDSLRAMTSACRLAAERGAAVTVLSVIEVPSELPLDAHMVEEEAHARVVLDKAEAIGDVHDVDVETRVMRARGAGPAIVDEATRAGAQIIVLTASRRTPRRRRSPCFGETASYVLQNALCRVLVSVRKT